MENSKENSIILFYSWNNGLEERFHGQSKIIQYRVVAPLACFLARSLRAVSFAVQTIWIFPNWKLFGPSVRVSVKDSRAAHKCNVQSKRVSNSFRENRTTAPPAIIFFGRCRSVSTRGFDRKTSVKKFNSDPQTILSLYAYRNWLNLTKIDFS